MKIRVLQPWFIAVNLHCLQIFMQYWHHSAVSCDKSMSSLLSSMPAKSELFSVNAVPEFRGFEDDLSLWLCTTEEQVFKQGLSLVRKIASKVFAMRICSCMERIGRLVLHGLGGLV